MSRVSDIKRDLCLDGGLSKSGNRSPKHAVVGLLTQVESACDETLMTSPLVTEPPAES